jgi:hypothetical protein
LVAGRGSQYFLFHARALARSRTNIIKFLKKDDGSKCEDQDGIKSMVYEFYENLFTSKPYDALDAVLQAIQ